MQWTAKELKLMALALNVSSTKGEVDNAAVMVIRSLRDRKIEVSMLNGYEKPKQEKSEVDWGKTKLNFGKHKGKTFKDVPPDYLIWLRAWIREDSDRMANFKYLTIAINKYLEGE